MVLIRLASKTSPRLSKMPPKDLGPISSSTVSLPPTQSFLFTTHHSLICYPATGVVTLIKAGASSLAPRGTLVFIGASADPNFSMDINITQHMMNGSKIWGCCEGDSLPHEVCRSIGFGCEDVLTRVASIVHPRVDQVLPRGKVAAR